MYLKRHLICSPTHTHICFFSVVPILENDTYFHIVDPNPNPFMLSLNTFKHTIIVVLPAGSVCSIFLEQYFLNLLISHLPQFFCPLSKPSHCPWTMKFQCLSNNSHCSTPFLLQTLFYKAGSLIIYKCKSDHTLFCSDSAVSSFYSTEKQISTSLKWLCMISPTSPLM